MTDKPKDQNSATWKFEFEDTVNADPLAKGACLKVIRALLNFASPSDPKAYCSLPDLMLLTASSRPTVKKALKLLVQLKYLVPLYLTDSGTMMYRLQNIRKQVIDDHLTISKQTLATERAERKRSARKRGKETCPPQDDNPERNLPPEVKESFPNTVEGYRRGSSYEDGRWGEEGNIGHSSPSYALAQSGEDSSSPLPVPRDDAEADLMIDAICEGFDVPHSMRTRMTEMLVAGVLSPSLAARLLGVREEAA